MTENLANLHSNIPLKAFEICAHQISVLHLIDAHSHNKTLLQKHLCEIFQNPNLNFVTYHSKLFPFNKVDHCMP